jgi:hypothetical protein
VRFRTTRKGVVVADVDPVEAQLLARCATDLLALLGDDDSGSGEQDPLEALVGLAGGPVEAPADPALARLLPDAYADDASGAPHANREFRRYTDADLRAGKRAHAGLVLATLPDGGGRLTLDRDQADAWLGFLNDLRLVMGIRLEVSEETDPDALPDDDPRLPALQVYAWLGWVQETLVSCLSPRR